MSISESSNFRKDPSTSSSSPYSGQGIRYYAVTTLRAGSKGNFTWNMIV